MNEKIHTQVMREVLNKIQEKPLVLKGGTALMLCYGLDRFSEDLDLDIRKSYTGNGTINLVNSLKSIEHTDFEILNVATKKDTAAITRYMLDYVDKNKNERGKLKIEISYRTPAPDNNINFINGIQVLDVGKITEFKIGSVIDQEKDSRTKARDLYDAAFIARKYPESISNEQLEQLAVLDIQYLLTRYENAFNDDPLLTKKDLDTIVLGLIEDVNEALDQRESNTNELAESKNEDSLNEYYSELREILNQPTTSRAQREFKQQIEKEITETRIYQLERDPISGNYDFEHLSKIHEKIFENLYDWAGEVRLDDISKRAIAPDGSYELGHFLYKDQISDEFVKFSNNIHENNYLKDLEKESFVKAFTKLYAQINEIHPFEEGNGRATKLLMNQLAKDAGYEMDLSAVSVSDWNYACKRSLTDQEKYIDSELDTERMPKDISLLEDVMNKVIKPYEIDYRNEANKENDRDNDNHNDLPTPGF